MIASFLLYLYKDKPIKSSVETEPYLEGPEAIAKIQSKKIFVAAESSIEQASFSTNKSDNVILRQPDLDAEEELSENEVLDHHLESSTYDNTSEKHSRPNEKPTLLPEQEYRDYMGPGFDTLAMRVDDSVRYIIDDLIRSDTSEANLALMEKIRDFLSELDIQLSVEGLKCNDTLCEIRILTEDINDWRRTYFKLKRQSFFSDFRGIRNITNSDNTHFVLWFYYR